MTALAGLVLAAGAGRRMGVPKALLVDDDGTPRLVRTVDDLAAAGCTGIVVTLGASAEQAAALLDDREVTVVVADDWAEGMAAGLRRGLHALLATEAPATLITLVDLPDVGPPVLRRVREAWAADGAREDALLRATYAGTPGHPVLLGRAHWAALAAEVAGDTGAGPYLRRRTVREVTCDDLATGRDLDHPGDLPGAASAGGGR